MGTYDSKTFFTLPLTVQLIPSSDHFQPNQDLCHLHLWLRPGELVRRAYHWLQCSWWLLCKSSSEWTVTCQCHRLCSCGREHCSADQQCGVWSGSRSGQHQHTGPSTILAGLVVAHNRQLASGWLPQCDQHQHTPSTSLWWQAIDSWLPYCVKECSWMNMVFSVHVPIRYDELLES